MYLKLYPHELTWISIYAFYEALLGSKLDLHSLQIYYNYMSSKLILFIYKLTTNFFNITVENLPYTITDNIFIFQYGIEVKI